MNEELQGLYISYLVAKRKILKLCADGDDSVTVEWAISAKLDEKTAAACRKAAKCST